MGDLLKVISSSPGPVGIRFLGSRCKHSANEPTGVDCGGFTFVLLDRGEEPLETSFGPDLLGNSASVDASCVGGRCLPARTLSNDHLSG